MDRVPSLLPAAALVKRDPGQRLLGVLLRATCISLALSDKQLQHAEPLGAVLLHGGRVPLRVLSKMLKPHTQQLAGVVIGSEQHVHAEALGQDPVASSALAEVHGMVSRLHPGLPSAWWGGWTAEQQQAAAAGAGGSGSLACSITPRRPAPAVAAAAAGSQRPVTPASLSGGSSIAVANASPVGQQAQQQQQQPGGKSGVVCSLATLFLQHCLDHHHGKTCNEHSGEDVMVKGAGIRPEP